MIFFISFAHFARFTVIARVDKRLQFSQARKAVQCTVRKLQVYPA